jgi:hypothetical protein
MICGGRGYAIEKIKRGVNTYHLMVMTLLQIWNHLREELKEEAVLHIQILD